MSCSGLGEGGRRSGAQRGGKKLAGGQITSQNEGGEGGQGEEGKLGVASQNSTLEATTIQGGGLGKPTDTCSTKKKDWPQEIVDAGLGDGENRPSGKKKVQFQCRWSRALPGAATLGTGRGRGKIDQTCEQSARAIHLKRGKYRYGGEGACWPSARGQEERSKNKASSLLSRKGGLTSG